MVCARDEEGVGDGASETPSHNPKREICMKARPGILTVTLIAGFVRPAGAQAPVPSPSQTPAVVIVSGHTSTAVNIVVRKVGSQIPKTYAGDKIHSTPGFDFYVSRHYALQSNMGDAYSENALVVAELAYPHWVDLVGAEPPDPDTRMYFVYASTADLMKKVIANDT